MQKNDLEGLTRRRSFVTIRLVLAGIAHLVERHLAKVEVASSSLVARSKSLIRKDGAFLQQAAANSLPPPACEARCEIRGEAGFQQMAGGRRRDAGKRVRASLPAPKASSERMRLFCCEAFLLLKFKSSMPSGCMSCVALSHWDSGPAGKTAEERVNFHKVYGLSLYNSGKNWYNDVQYFVERREIP